MTSRSLSGSNPPNGSRPATSTTGALRIPRSANAARSWPASANAISM